MCCNVSSYQPAPASFAALVHKCNACVDAASEPALQATEGSSCCQDIERQTGRRQPGSANFTLNKSLSHVVNHIRRVVESQGGAAPGGVMEALDVTGSNEAGPASQSAHTANDETPDQIRIIEAAVKACNTPVVFIRMDGGVFDSNMAFCQMLGYESHELDGNTIYMHAAAPDIAPLMAAICDIITEKTNSCTAPIRLQHKNGHPVQCTLDISGQHVPASPEKMYIVIFATEDAVDPCLTPHALHISLDNLSLNDASSEKCRPSTWSLVIPAIPAAEREVALSQGGFVRGNMAPAVQQVAAGMMPPHHHSRLFVGAAGSAGDAGGISGGGLVNGSGGIRNGSIRDGGVAADGMCSAANRIQLHQHEQQHHQQHQVQL